uniref:Nucleolar 27S pre-rRNA processing Urb2/Npa2 C-terminal domain-containing protein n=2 Tax=Plectus sambesii TaxID=2011161 RepID=A0A914XMF2_9BILA
MAQHGSGSGTIELWTTIDQLVGALKAARSRPMADFVQEAIDCRRLEMLIDALVVMFNDVDDFELDAIARERLSSAFATVAPALTTRMASALLSVLEKESRGDRRTVKIALLLRTLVQSVTLRKSGKLCDVVKERVGALYHRLCEVDGASEALSLTLALLADTLASVILVQVVYEPTPNKSALFALWRDLDAPRKGGGRLLHMCVSLQVRAALSESTSELLGELVGDSGLGGFVANDKAELLVHFHPSVEVWKSVSANFATLVSLCSSEEADRLAEVVWKALHRAASKSDNDLLPLLSSIVSSPCVWELHKIRRHLIKNLLTVLQTTVEESDGPQKAIWLEKLADMIADQAPSVDSATRKPSLVWAKVMGKFFDHHEPLLAKLTWRSTDTFRRVVGLIDTLPVRYLPLELKTTVLGAALMLGAFVAIGKDYSTLQSLLNIVADLLSSDVASLRSYMSRLRNKLNWWLKMIVELAPHLSQPHSAATIVGHSLTASDSVDAFIERVDLVLLAADACSLPRWHFQIAAAVLQSCQDLPQFDEQQSTSVAAAAVERVAQFLRPKLEAVTWRNAKRVSPPEEVTSLTAAFLPFRLLHKVGRRVKADDFACSQFNADMIRLAKKIVVRDANQFGAEAVRDSVDFLLLAHSMGFERSLATTRFILPLALVSTDLAARVIRESDPSESDELLSDALSAMDEEEMSTSTLCALLSVPTQLALSTNDHKRDVVKAKTEAIVAAVAKKMALIVSAIEPTIAVLELANALLQVIGKTGRDVHAAVGFCLSLFSTLSMEPLSDKNLDRRLMRALHALLNNSLKFSSAVVASGMAAMYSICVCNFIGAVIVRCPIDDDERLDAKLEACQMVSRLCSLIASHKTEFAKVAPYMIAEYVTKSLERGVHPAAKSVLLTGMHRLLHICDKYGVAMLSSNLPPGPKDIFAHMFREYKKFAVFAV